MSRPARMTVRTALLAIVIAAAAGGCGQRGPLTLPEDARPIERLPQQPPAPAAPAAPQDDEEEQRNER